MKIPKFILISLLSTLLQLSGYAHDPSDFHSVQEVLDFETAQIADLSSANS